MATASIALSCPPTHPRINNARSALTDSYLVSILIHTYPSPFIILPIYQPLAIGLCNNQRFVYEPTCADRMKPAVYPRLSTPNRRATQVFTQLSVSLCALVARETNGRTTDVFASFLYDMCLPPLPPSLFFHFRHLFAQARKPRSLILSFSAHLSNKVSTGSPLNKPPSSQSRRRA